MWTKPSSADGEPKAPLVDRERESEEIRRALLEHRLVTVVGAPGVGKTRLAQELASGSRDVFCSASRCTSASDVLGALAPLVTSDGRTDEAAVLGAISARGSVIIVLDGFDRCLRDATASLGRILANAPEARLLVTSREPTDLEEEVRIELGPLDEASSVRLFVERARATHAPMRTTDADVPTIREIVKRLDGLPFAIELAAGRTSLLSPREVLARLVARFDLLRRARKSSHAQFSTLRESIDSSWELLDGDERRALARLSVFEGPIPLDAAEGIVQAGPSTLDMLQALRAKSLIARDTDDTIVLYESVRTYAAERLAEMGHSSAAAHHAAYVERCLGTAKLDPRDVLAAHTYFHARDDARAARFALAASPVLALGGPRDAHIEMLTSARRTFGSAGDDEGTTRVDAALGAACEAAGRVDESVRALEGAASRARELGLAALAADCLEQLGHVEWRRGNLAAARTTWRESLAGFERTDDVRGQARVMGRMGLLEQDAGRFDEAEELHRGALSLHARPGAQTPGGAQARELLHLARLAHKRGLLTDAATLASRARALAVETGERRTAAIAEAQTGVVAQERGELVAARNAYERARVEVLELGDRRYFGILETLVAVLDIEDGRLGAARERLGAAIAVHEEVQNLAFEGAARGYLAVALVLASELQEAHAQVVEGISCAERASYLAVAAWLWSVRAYVEHVFGREDDARAALASARATIATAHEPGFGAAIDVLAARVEGGAEPSAAGSPYVEVRLSRMLVESSGTTAPPAIDAHAQASPARFRVDVRGRWLERDGSARVPIVRRPSLRLVLAALARSRRDVPGKGIPWDELLLIGWPDERMQGGAGMARVYTLVRTLRRLGLEGALVTQPDGYALRPNLVSVDGSAAGGTSQTPNDGSAAGGTSQTPNDGSAAGGTSQTPNDGSAAGGTSQTPNDGSAAGGT